MQRASAYGIDPLEHMGWARGVAVGVGKAFRFDRLTSEMDDLEQTALLAMVRYAMTFDPSRVPADGDVVGAFRGYAHRELQSECRREARRLRNGGTYRTRREKDRKPIIPESLQDFVTPTACYGDLLDDKREPAFLDVDEKDELVRIAHLERLEYEAFIRDESPR